MIQRHGALTRILRQKRSAHIGFVQFAIVAELSRQIAMPDGFDFDDIGPKSRDLIASQRPERTFVTSRTRIPCNGLNDLKRLPLVFQQLQEKHG